MRIALTGASGFTGRYVADALDRAGFGHVALDVDLRDPSAVDQAVAGTRFDALIHLAGKAFVDSTDWQSFYTVNQIGTFNLLDAVARHHPASRCVLAGSAQVYGPGAEGLIGESTPINPANHYAISKAAMELGASAWKDRLDIVIARPFNYTGIGQGVEYLVPKLVDHFRRKASVVELGNTWVKRDFGDVRSVADAYVELVRTKDAPQIVNLCTGVVHSIDNILSILSELSGHSLEIRVNQNFVRAHDVPVLGGDPARLHQTLPGWKHYPLRDTLSWMYHLDSKQSTIR